MTYPWIYPCKCCDHCKATITCSRRGPGQAAPRFPRFLGSGASRGPFFLFSWPQEMGQHLGLFLVSRGLSNTKKNLFQGLHWDPALGPRAHTVRARISGLSEPGKVPPKSVSAKILANPLPENVTFSLISLTSKPLSMWSILPCLHPILFLNFVGWDGLAGMDWLGWVGWDGLAGMAGLGGLAGMAGLTARLAARLTARLTASQTARLTARLTNSMASSAGLGGRMFSILKQG